MNRICTSFVSAALSLSMLLTAAPPVFAETAQPIRTVSFANVSTGLVIGEAPAFTAYLTGDALLYANIMNEGWGCTSDMSIHASKSEGLPVPSEPVGVPYRYLIALTADDGWYFPEDFTLVYEDQVIDSAYYTATLRESDTLLMLECRFLPDVVPFSADMLYGDVNQDGRLSVSDPVLLHRYLAEDADTHLTDAGLAAGDLNRDGVITVLDIARLMQMLTEPSAVSAAPQPAETADTPENLPELGELSWIYAPDGNSSEYTDNTIEGLTVTVGENVLSYDGQLQFAAMTAEDMDRAETLISDSGALLLDGWHVEAGLGTDGHLPGYYACDYDLSTLDIPEDMYDRIRVLRVDDAGEITEYDADRDGANLHWESDQNSITLVVEVSALAVVAGIYAYKLYSERDKVWDDSETSDTLKWAETDHCYIQYADLSLNEEDRKREARMKLAVKNAEDAVRQRAEELAEEHWIAWGADSPGFRKEVNRNIAKLREEYLRSDEAYQEDLAAENGAPADVVLLGDLVEKAYWYLRLEENCPYFSKKPVIYFGSAVPGDGQAGKTMLGKHYILLHRSTKTAQHVKADMPREEIYGTLVDAGIADRYLITLTHEMYHVYQNTQLSTHSRSTLKFSEMSAVLVEHRAGAYFLREGDLTSYTEDLSNKFETYGIPLETHNLSEKYLIPTGYTLGRFWEFVERNRTPMKGWDMVLSFKENGSVLKMLANEYSMKVDNGDNPYWVLNAYWKAFHKRNLDTETGRASYVVKATSEDDLDQALFPSLLNNITLGGDVTNSFVKVKHKNLACTQTVIRSDDKNWSVLLERNADFAELQPEHTFLIPSDSAGIPAGAESRKGPLINTNSRELLYAEVQGYGSLGASGYTVHYIPAPETPDVVYDEENQQFTVTLKSAPSKEGTAGYTDRFLLTCRISGTETATFPVDYENWSEPVVIPVGDMHLNIREKCTLQISVCEVIDAEGEYPQCRAASAAPFEMAFGEIGFPVINTTLTATGTCGTAAIGQQSDSHFSLDSEGHFSFTMDAGSWDDGVDVGSNPFALESTKGHYSGFTVSGKVTDAETPYSWTAEITDATGSYSAYYSEEYMAINLSRPAQNGIQEIRYNENSWSGAFDGAPSGTLQFEADPDSGTARIVISLNVPMASAKEETMTEGSVKVSGLMNFNP